MNIKTLAATALLASTLTVVSAENLHSTAAPVSGGPGFWSTPIDAVHLQAGVFTDVFELGSFAHAVVADGNLSTISFGLPSFNVDFVEAWLGNDETAVHYGFLPESGFGYEDGDVTPSIFAAGRPLTLTVKGVAAAGLLAGSNVSASYSGNVNFAAVVPEPTTTALLLAGLAAVGWLARRRLA